MGKLVAIVEDEPDIVDLIMLHLKRAGFTTQSFNDAKTFYAFLGTKIPDLVILDLMLPDTDGLEICKYLRKHDEYASLPIIILTARADETDRILGLELGADDYVTKPFSPRELLARVKAVLRRQEPKEAAKKITLGALVVDTEKYDVFLAGKRIVLTPTEFNILKLLLLKKGRVFTRDQILDHLWGTEKAVIDRTIDVHIKHLREKLGDVGQCIKNIRGVGYKVEE